MNVNTTFNEGTKIRKTVQKTFFLVKINTYSPFKQIQNSQVILQKPKKIRFSIKFHTKNIFFRFLDKFEN